MTPPPGFNTREQDPVPRAPEPVSQGDPSRFLLQYQPVPLTHTHDPTHPPRRPPLLCSLRPLTPPLPPADCKVDLAFLMDGSWSIGKRRFKIQKDFLAEVAQVINLGVAGPMMGVIQYGYHRAPLVPWA